jgi:rare lipoprotein A
LFTLRSFYIIVTLSFLITLSGCWTRSPSPAGTHPGDDQYPLPSTTTNDGKLLATQRPYTVNGHTYNPLPSAAGYQEIGLASWYGPNFHGKSTSNGEKYDMEAMTAAHKTLPMNTYVRVTNLNSKQSAVVRINDRGPFVESRIIDLSKAAARGLGVLGPGTAKVEVVALGYRRQGTGGNTSTPAQYEQPASYNDGVFTVQVGAFSDPKNADNLLAKLKSQWGEAFIQRYDRGDQIFYRVRVGRFTTLQSAQQFTQRLKAAGYGQAVAVGW